MAGNRKIEVRVDDERRAAYEAAAEAELTSLSEWVRAACDARLAAGASPPPVLRTKSGRVLADADVEAFADEAERGYDVADLARRDVTPMFKPERKR